jgi:hypothetical protein
MNLESRALTTACDCEFCRDFYLLTQRLLKKVKFVSVLWNAPLGARDCSYSVMSAFKPLEPEIPEKTYETVGLLHGV